MTGRVNGNIRQKKSPLGTVEIRGWQPPCSKVATLSRFSWSKVGKGKDVPDSPM